MTGLINAEIVSVIRGGRFGTVTFLSGPVAEVPDVELQARGIDVVQYRQIFNYRSQSLDDVHKDVPIVWSFHSLSQRLMGRERPMPITTAELHENKRSVLLVDIRVDGGEGIKIFKVFLRYNRPHRLIDTVDLCRNQWGSRRIN